ncbi:MAG: hypothetical protein K2X86_11755 [Cytophagaceae bacterium]|nr:hypothetical protein [Cytophagaceae bacterium]
MLKFFLFSLVFVLPLFLSAQDTTANEEKSGDESSYFIEKINLSVSFPNKSWVVKPKITNVGHSTVYEFIKQNKTDSFPTLQIIVEELRTPTDLTPYSLSKQKAYKGLKDYKVQKVFTESDGMLRLNYAVGNKATYTEASGRKKVFYFIHAIRDKRALQVIIDLPADKFAKLEWEIVEIIQSLEYQ